MPTELILDPLDGRLRALVDHAERESVPPIAVSLPWVAGQTDVSVALASGTPTAWDDDRRERSSRPGRRPGRAG